MAIGQKIRFEVFKRDGFVCRYCGKKPPKTFIKLFNKHEIIEAIDIAYGKFANRPYNQDVNTFKYMCGILHNWRRQRYGEDTIPKT